LSCGIISCQSPEAIKWVKEAVATVTELQYRAWEKGEHDFIYLRVTIPNGFDSIDDIQYLETALLYHPELTKCDWTIKRKYRLLVKGPDGGMVERGKRALIIQSLPPALDYIKKTGVLLPPRSDGPPHPAWLLNGLFSQFRVSVASASDLTPRVTPAPPSPPRDTEVEPEPTKARIQATPIHTKLKVDEYVRHPKPAPKSTPRQLFPLPPRRELTGIATINESLERTDIRENTDSATSGATINEATGDTPFTTPAFSAPGSSWAEDDVDSEAEHMDDDNSTNMTPEEEDRLLGIQH